MASVAEAPPAARPIRAKLGKDDWTLRLLIGLVALYLLATLAFPLYAILTKSATVYDFQFAEIGIEEGADGTWEDLGTAADWVDQLAAPVNDGRLPTARTRLPARDIFPKDHFSDGAILRFQDRSASGGLLLY
ncbi:MAG: hypothetical protein AAF543_24520, partial [Pseudomonadota bacterium]